MDSDKLVDAAYNGLYASYLRNGSLRDEDVSVAFKEIVRQSVGQYLESNPTADVIPMDDLELPRSESAPDLTSMFEVVVKEDGLLVTSEDLDVYINIPPADLRVGNIPDADVNLEGDFPTLPNAVLSDDMLDKTKEAIIKQYGADRTRGFDIRYENRVPDFVKDDPYGADYTGQMVIADE